MSIIDLIMEQKLILITLCLAGAPLLTALTLFVVTTMRKRQAERAEEARRLAARRKTMQAVARARRNAAAEAAALEEEVQPEAQEGEVPNPAMVKKIQAGPAAAGAKPVGGAAPAPAGAAPAGLPADKPTDKPGEEGVSDAMQSLLSDVFADDEAGARLDRLLVGVADVAVDDLADLARSIAARLHDQAVPVKE